MGLLAWMLEKYRAWSDHGENVTGLSTDVILTQVSLYWFTQSISSSFRPYWEHRRQGFPPIDVSVPTGLAVFPADLVHPPASWAARNHNLVHYSRMEAGGHFAALEQSDALAADIRRFTATVRSSTRDDATTA